MNSPVRIFPVATGVHVARFIAQAGYPCPVHRIYGVNPEHAR